MSDPFYTYPSETTTRLDALLGEPVHGPKEWACTHRPDVSEIPETISQGLGQSMQLDGRKGTLRNPQPPFPECPPCPHYRGDLNYVWLCAARGWFMGRRAP
jgi:hypothetical protein